MPTRLTSLGRVALAATVLAVGGCRTAPMARVSVVRGIRYTEAADLDVFRPAAGRGLPVVVTLHGCCGSRSNLAPLAARLAENGTVVYNASWRGTDSAGGGYPGAYEDAACAVRFARATAGAYGGDPRRVALVGWSDGALVGAVTAAAGDDFAGGCRAGGDAGTAEAVPDSFVALAGFFGWTPARDGTVGAPWVNDRTTHFFGGSPADVPMHWSVGNPYTHLERRRLLPIRLVVGQDDPLLVDSQCFARAARAAGHPVGLVVAPGAGHQTVIAPRYTEGKLAVREILLAARGVVPPPPPPFDLAAPTGPCPDAGGPVAALPAGDSG